LDQSPSAQGIPRHADAAWAVSYLTQPCYADDSGAALYGPLSRGDEGPVVTERLLALLAAVSVGGAQVHDANIVATMQVYGIRQLLTHNVDDFTRFSAFITVVPLIP
jgi:hypothetical protein